MVKRIGLAIAAAVAALVVFTPSVAQADPPGWWLQYRNVAGGQCMDVKDSSTGNGAIIQDYPCKSITTSGADNQEFQVQAAGSGAQFVNLHSLKCMDLTAAGTVQQWTCTGAVSQQWTMVFVSQNHNGTENWLFKSVSSGKCLHHQVSGSPLYQVTCNSADTNQVWRDNLADSGCTTCRPVPAAVPGRE